MSQDTTRAEPAASLFQRVEQIINRIRPAVQSRVSTSWGATGAPGCTSLRAETNQPPQVTAEVEASLERTKRLELSTLSLGIPG